MSIFKNGNGSDSDGSTTASLAGMLFKCSYCYMAFDSFQILASHQNGHHRSEMARKLARAHLQATTLSLRPPSSPPVLPPLFVETDDQSYSFGHHSFTCVHTGVEFHDHDPLLQYYSYKCRNSLMTNVHLCEYMPIVNIGGEQEGGGPEPAPEATAAKLSLERIVSNPATVMGSSGLGSGGGEGGSSQQENKEVDWELKLWF